MTLSKLKKDKKLKIINRNLYASSIIIFIFTIIINIINLVYNPFLLNGLILEINIAVASFSIYLYIKMQKEIDILNEKELDIKVRTILNTIE